MIFSSLIVASLLAPLVDSVYLSKPRGRYNVGFTQHIFNHTTLFDPSSPTGTGTFFLCSIYYPTLDSLSGSNRVPYFDPISAEIWGEVFRRYPSDLLSIETTLQWQAAILNKNDARTLSQNPTLVFSPGGGTNAFMYTSLLSDLASHGYTILALDHPGEAPYLSLPYNASGVVGWDIYMPYNESIIQSVFEYRTGDILALLSPERFPALVEQYGAPFNTKKYGAFGHSVGGAASTAAMDRLDNIVAVANIDGGFFGDSVNASLDGRPFFMMASESHTEESDPTWTAFVEKYAAEGGWLDYLRVKGAAHLAFSDIPQWVELLPPIPNTTAIVDLGTIPGKRIDQLLKTYVSAFWEFVSGGKYNARLLDESSKKWPEVWFNKTVRP